MMSVVVVPASPLGAPSVRAGLLCGLAVLLLLTVDQGIASDVVPLSFTKEPPSKLEFVSTKGGSVDCAATGSPRPAVAWSLIDGSPVTNLPGLREVTPSGTLVFHSFRPEGFRPDVHFASYRCVASSDAGTIVSREVKVHGVVAKNHDIQVYDSYATAGNTAVFQCHIPSILKDHLKVVGWIKNDNLLIQPAIEMAGNDKYVVVPPSGDLHVHDVVTGESGSRYKCKAVHQLTGESLISSTAGRLFVTDSGEPKSRGTVPPKILQGTSNFAVAVGQSAVLPCVAQGTPNPTTSWNKKSSSGQLHPLDPNSRVIQIRSALIIKQVQVRDAGTYVCRVNNELGQDQVDIVMTVSEPLSVSVQPTRLEAKVNVKAVFRCVVSGQPVASMQWLRNGVTIQKETSETLTIESVQMADQGFYQCVVKNSDDAAQGVAELRLSEIPPQLVETFEETTVQPGRSVTLRCVAAAVPSPTITWNVDGVAIKDGARVRLTLENGKEGRVSSSLIIQKSQTEDGGSYSCIAANNAGKIEHNARVNVYGSLGTRTVPQKSVVSGSDIVLSCPVFGYPITKITWEKDNKMLLQNIRRRVIKNGSLSMKDVDRTMDSGIYDCTAFDEAGHSVKSKLEVAVLVPPKIIPFEFQDELLREGMRARLQCVVSEGDLPLSVSWLKDGKPIPSELGIMIRALDEYSSILTLSSITPAHNGKFTCVASNMAATVTHTAELSVNVPPKIIPFAFLDDQFYKGMRAHVTCAISHGDLPVTFWWLKDGEVITPDMGIVTRKYDGHTDSLSIENVGSHHSGNYTCSVQNNAGTAEYTAQLMVRVAPKIVPFEFGDLLVEGSPARVVCGLQEGDAPIEFSWLFNGVHLAKGGQIAIHELDSLSSILSISKLSANHTGTFTCLAQNVAGKTKHDAALRVTVPPRWVVSPQSTSVVGGQNVLLNCQAEGFPKPTVSWTKLVGDLITDLSNDGKFMIYANGSLLITSVEGVDEANYICTAENGIGRGLSTGAEVNIYAPPTFKSMLKNINTTLGESAEIRCIVNGDAPITVTWTKNDSLIKGSHPSYKFQTTTADGSAVTTVLTVKSVTRGDNGKFSCIAENSYGKNQSHFQLAVAEKPDPPTDLKVTSSSSQFVELVWRPQHDGNSPIKKYIIQYKVAHNSWDEAITMETVNGEPTNSVVTHLQPATHYAFRLFSENANGRSAASQTLRVTTNEDVPSGVPLGVQVESVNTETFRVTWKAPEEKTWNGRLLGYYVGYKEVDTEDPFLYKTLLTPNPKADDLSVQIGGLKQFTKYSVVVQAYNGQGKGPESESVVIMTSEGAPSLPPTDIRCTTLTSTSIHVTWEAPPADSVNGIIRGYKVLYKPASDWFDDLAESFNVTLPTSLTLNHLEKFSNYSIQALIMTKAGDGPRSKAVFCKTLDDVPSSPVDIKAIATSDDSVIVAWKPPDHVNGVLRSFSVHLKEADSAKTKTPHTLPAHEHSYEATGLKRGRRYEFWVTASTAMGEGAPSRKVTQTPSGPTVPARVVSFEEKIISSWKSDISLACRAVGIPDFQRRWTFKGRNVESATKMSVGGDGVLRIKDLREEDGGDYTCHVQNDIGEDKITYTIIVLAPPSSPIVEVMAVTSNAIEVQWKTPSSKMSRIKGYSLHLRKDSGEWKETTLGADVRSYRISSLDCGTRYEIFMAAFNKIGVGAPSEIILVSTNGSVPAVPTKTDFIEETSSSVSLYLTTWKSNGCPILYFVVEYSARTSNEWTFLSNHVRPEQRRLVIPNLRPATWYRLRVTAHNSAGSAVAQYDFATLTSTGATIPTDVLSDSNNEQLDNLWAYLNLYIIVPICCTVVILLAILGVACYYVKTRNNRAANQGNVKAAPGTQLKRGDSSESFSYIQRGTVNRAARTSKHGSSDITPYATLQLANHRGMHTMRREPPDQAPPLPPPRMPDNFPSHMPQQHMNIPQFHNMNNPQFFCPPGSSNFIQAPATAETTFVFPGHANDDGIVHHFQPQYPHEVRGRSRFRE